MLGRVSSQMEASFTAVSLKSGPPRHKEAGSKEPRSKAPFAVQLGIQLQAKNQSGNENHAAEDCIGGKLTNLTLL
jgi:hypothetical protein